MENFKILSDPSQKLESVYEKLLKEKEGVKYKIAKIIDWNIDEQISKQEEEARVLLSDIVIARYTSIQIENIIRNIRDLMRNNPNNISITEQDISDALLLHKVKRSIFLLRRIEWSNIIMNLRDFDGVNEFKTEQIEDELLKLWYVNAEDISEAKNQKIISYVKCLFEFLEGKCWNITQELNKDIIIILRRIIANYSELVSYDEDNFKNAEQIRRDKYKAFESPSQTWMKVSS